MPALIPALRLLGDESRLRLLRLLAREELSVAELQEILAMGQSRISMSLAQLKKAGLADLRRVGQKSLYSFVANETIAALLEESARELPEAAKDDEALRLILRKRKDKMRGYFDELAGRFGRHYVPGRSWKGLAEMCIKLLPPMVIADIGAGEGTLSLLLSQRAEKVIGVDNSEKMVEYAAGVARKNKVSNVDFRLGDLEELPIEDESIDLALFSQSLHHALHPQRAAAEAWRVLKPGGRIVVLDLMKHNFEQARELYADVWLGFSPAELNEFLRKSRFKGIDVVTVHKEEEAPHFETLLAVGEKR
ncbi:MAG: metalloregulator ArsR/SmtB family transcription factor [Acidobacteria bacterium]|nr:metalloregulator ArsR/SmtB family transcription factor [Acidobacteriota bacterium]MBM3769381.1 metalloregulator ArsR/SmtB family transcription factor [Acidobacteriota bacterium]